MPTSPYLDTHNLRLLERTGFSPTNTRQQIHSSSLDTLFEEINTLFTEYKSLTDAEEGTDSRFDFYTWQIALRLTPETIQAIALDKVKLDLISIESELIKLHSEMTHHKSGDPSYTNKLASIEKLQEKEIFYRQLKLIIEVLQEKISQNKELAYQHFHEVKKYFHKLHATYQIVHDYFTTGAGSSTQAEELSKEAAKKNYFIFIKKSLNAVCDFLLPQQEGHLDNQYYKTSEQNFISCQNKHDCELEKSHKELIQSHTAYCKLKDALASQNCKQAIASQSDKFSVLDTEMLIKVTQMMKHNKELLRNRHLAGFFASSRYTNTFKNSLRQAQARSISLIKRHKGNLNREQATQLISLVGMRLGYSIFWTNSRRRSREAIRLIYGNQSRSSSKTCPSIFNLFKKTTKPDIKGWGFRNGREFNFKVETANGHSNSQQARPTSWLSLLIMNLLKLTAPLRHKPDQVRDDECENASSTSPNAPRHYPT